MLLGSTQFFLDCKAGHCDGCDECKQYNFPRVAIETTPLPLKVVNFETYNQCDISLTDLKY